MYHRVDHMGCNSVEGLQVFCNITNNGDTVFLEDSSLKVVQRIVLSICTWETDAAPALHITKRNLSNVYSTERHFLRTFTYQYSILCGKTKWVLHFLTELKSLFLNAICCYNACCVFNDYRTCKQNAVLVLYSCNSWLSQIHTIKDRNNSRDFQRYKNLKKSNLAFHLYRHLKLPSKTKGCIPFQFN